MQIRYSGYINSTGYSISAQDYILAIQRVNPLQNIKIIAINGAKRRSGISEERFLWYEQLSKTKPEPKFISIQHCIPPIYVNENASKKVGIAVYETIDPPFGWVHKMNEMDEIIVASTFNKGVFETAGVKKPIHLVPHCFDNVLFNKNVIPKGRYNLFTFMYIATWRDRKNFSSLIQAFYDEFSMKDKVCLVLKTDKVNVLKNTINSIKKSGWRTKDTAPIYIEENVVSFEEIPSLMKKADVCISPSFGEGFGLFGLNSMALGIPLITVKYGGSLEYAKPEFCTYINPAEYKTRPVMDGLSQFKNKIWPEIRISEIKNKMRFVFSSYSSIKKIADSAYNYVHSHFNYEIIGRRFLSAVGEI